MSNYDFVTDRLAIGNVASRATPGFVAVVSVLATAPWDEVAGAPTVPNETPVLHIDLTDGESKRVRPDNGETYGHDLDEYLDDADVLIYSIRKQAESILRAAGLSWSTGWGFAPHIAIGPGLRSGPMPATIRFDRMVWR